MSPEVLVPGAIHSLHKQTMQWIFTHGGRAVVTTSQLLSRGETPPISVNTLTRAFAVPAPPPDLPDDNSEFPLTLSPDGMEIEFEHWSLSTHTMEADESDTESDLSETEYDELAFKVQMVILAFLFLFMINQAIQASDTMEDIEADLLGPTAGEVGACDQCTIQYLCSDRPRQSRL
jgi:hypothetical protein